MKSTKKQQKTTKFLAAHTKYGYKIALLKHNNNQTYTVEFQKKKKKSRPTDPFFFLGGGVGGGACYSNTTFFFLFFFRLKCYYILKLMYLHSFVLYDFISISES